MSMDEKEWELYESRRLAIMDYNTGMIEAKEDGKKQERIKIAKKLLKSGMSIEEVENITELTKEEIEKL